MNKELLEQLETPCIVIDLKKTEENIKRMQAGADRFGCRLRPHIKTHKMPLFAHMQLKHGAVGITCAKVSEAEVMADDGIDDIFIAYPMVGNARIQRVIALAKRIGRLIVAVDSLEGADLLNCAAKQAGIILEIRLEIDTGAMRTGIKKTAVTLAKQIKELANLNLTGIFTFKSLVYQGKPSVDKEISGIEEGDLMEQIAKDIQSAGIVLEDVSAGSTPTGLVVAKTGKVNEIRPGTYIFNDYMLYKEEAADLNDIAVRIYATVVSTPCKEYAVIDGGTKTFPMDIPLGNPPYYYDSYAVVAGNADLKLNRMNEEHGMLTSTKGDTGLKVGDIIEMIPIHVCTAINMQNQVWLDDGNKVRPEKVAARGMLL